MCHLKNQYLIILIIIACKIRLWIFFPLLIKIDGVSIVDGSSPSDVPIMATSDPSHCGDPTEVITPVVQPTVTM